jgi:hypothetical protein
MILEVYRGKCPKGTGSLKGEGRKEGGGRKRERLMHASCTFQPSWSVCHHSCHWRKDLARFLNEHHTNRRLPNQQFLYPLPSPIPLKSSNPKSLVRINNGPSHTKMNVQTRVEMTNTRAKMTDTITAPCAHFGILKK